MEIIENQRSFEYDTKSLLGIIDVPPAPTNPGEVTMIISGLTGTWNGLSDGTHGLNGTETLGASHVWQYGVAMNDHLKMGAQSFGTNTTYRSMQFHQITGLHTTTMTMDTNLCTTTTARPCIPDGCFSSFDKGNGVFTWSRGVDWSRGNM